MSTSLELDLFYLSYARLISTHSEDPSTKVGCVIARPGKRIQPLLADGFNRFPVNMQQTAERMEKRSEKYDRVIHAEMTAILSARASLVGATLYCWPIPTCHRCAAHIIEAGIKRVVFPNGSKESDWSSRNRESLDKALSYYHECGVQVDFV